MMSLKDAGMKSFRDARMTYLGTLNTEPRGARLVPVSVNTEVCVLSMVPRPQRNGTANMFAVVVILLGEVRLLERYCEGSQINAT